MQFRTFFAQDELGNTVSGATISVYEDGTATLATVYDSLGAVITNPLTSDSTGKFEFAMPNGRYDMAVAAATKNYSAKADFFDATQAVIDVEGFSTSASDSANAALNSETNAGNSATVSSNQASLAEGYKNTALAARDATEATYDNFDDRYLGAKASPPTTDNDGDPLIEGALYWDSALAAMYVWNDTQGIWGSLDSGNLTDNLISTDTNKGASLVSMEGGPTVENAISQGVISWSGTRTYQIDSFANRAGVLYVCKTAGHISATAPESDATNWRLINAADVAYDNAASALVAETSQAAIDEIVATYYTKTESDAKFVEVGDTVTGTATFANSTNNINLTDIGSIAGLEVGDVIQVSGSVGNNSEFTVEVITDANNVIVNQAHAGGSATKSLATETSTAGVTVQLLVKWYDAPVGVGQGWVELFSSRTSGVTYTNSTGRAIVVRLASFAVGAITRVALTVDAFATYGNTTAALGGSTGHSSIETHINKGSTYEASILVNLDSWAELR
jgi:hypothetical protein